MAMATQSRDRFHLGTRRKGGVNHMSHGAAASRDGSTSRRDKLQNRVVVCSVETQRRRLTRRRCHGVIDDTPQQTRFFTDTTTLHNLLTPSSLVLQIKHVRDALRVSAERTVYEMSKDGTHDTRAASTFRTSMHNSGKNLGPQNAPSSRAFKRRRQLATGRSVPGTGNGGLRNNGVLEILYQAT